MASSNGMENQNEVRNSLSRDLSDTWPRSGTIVSLLFSEVSECESSLKQCEADPKSGSLLVGGWLERGKEYSNVAPPSPQALGFPVGMVIPT